MREREEAAEEREEAAEEKEQVRVGTVKAKLYKVGKEVA